MNLLTLEKNRIFDYLDNIKSENLGFSFSFLLHSLLLFFVIGLPNFFDPKPISIPTIIPIEIINFTETTTNLSKKNSDSNLLEAKPKNVEVKKFSSSDNQEIQKVDIKEKKKATMKFEKEEINIDVNQIESLPKIKINKIEKKETPEQGFVIKKKKEVTMKIEKEEINIDVNQIESLPTKKIKPKLKPKINSAIENSDKQLDVTIKAKPKIEKTEKQQLDVKTEIQPIVKKRVKLKPKPEPEFDEMLATAITSLATELKDISNDQPINILEKIENKTEKDEVIAEDKKNEVNEEAESQAKISIGNAMKQQIRQCWSRNSGEKFEGAHYVVAKAAYKENGSVIEGSVQIIDTNVPQGSMLISGVKYALYTCRLKLPKEYYHLWDENKIRFDPDIEKKQINMNLFN